MQKIKKIITVIIFFLGATSVAYAFSPSFKTKVNKFLAIPLGGKKATQVSQQTNDLMNNILGETDKEGKVVKEELVNQLEQVSQKILSQEKVQEITQEVNQVITQKVEETKNLPAQGIEKAKEEIRKEIYQEVCEQWLK